MNNANPIKNIGDLRSEIIRLQAEIDEQEAVFEEKIDHISAQIKAPFQFLKKISTWFHGESTASGSSDWVTTIAQLGLPYLLNKTFFRSSGIIMKALIALVSQKAATGINSNKLTSWVTQLSEWIKKQSQKQANNQDYGIPPESETF